MVIEHRIHYFCTNSILFQEHPNLLQIIFNIACTLFSPKVAFLVQGAQNPVLGHLSDPRTLLKHPLRRQCSVRKQCVRVLKARLRRQKARGVDKSLGPLCARLKATRRLAQGPIYRREPGPLHNGWLRKAKIRKLGRLGKRRRDDSRNLDPRLDWEGCAAVVGHATIGAPYS